jgi:hypothetical protein
MSFLQWVRRTSEHYLMVDAMDRIGRKFDANTPLPPRGADLFWRRVYVPIFHRLPVRLRDEMIARMPGSHRKPWQPPPRLKGPAV